MSQGNLDLYHALKEAGASEERAELAAKSVAGGDRDLFFIKGLLTAMLALMLGLFWLQWQTIADVAEVKSELGAVQADVRAIANRLAAVEAKLEP
jgi:hypothetical protein